MTNGLGDRYWTNRPMFSSRPFAAVLFAPAPLPKNTETLAEPELATAKSRAPSGLKSRLFAPRFR
jgi:hypothetical protein